MGSDHSRFSSEDDGISMISPASSLRSTRSTTLRLVKSCAQLRTRAKTLTSRPSSRPPSPPLRTAEEYIAFDVFPLPSSTSLGGLGHTPSSSSVSVSSLRSGRPTTAGHPRRRNPARRERKAARILRRAGWRMSGDGRRYHNVPAVPYLLPSDEGELDRLAQVHYALKEMQGGALHTAAAPPMGIQRVLDVGCGGGAWALEMATAHPSVQVMGIDMVPVFPETILPRNCAFRLANILEGLPFHDGSFDLLYQRFLTLAIPEEVYAGHLRELWRVARPGAALEIVDTDLLFRRVGPHGAQINAWVEETVSHTGLRREVPLPVMMCQTGWSCTGRQSIPHRVAAEDDATLAQSYRSGTLGWLHGMRDSILEVCGVSGEEFDGRCSAFLAEELRQYGTYLEVEVVIAYRD